MGSPYKGVLYAGVMVTKDGPKLVEYNARFGDPECQVLMLRMMSDIVPALIACADGQLKNFSLRWFDDVALTVIMATKGYPGDYGKGFVIEGLDDAAKVEGVEIFHAGTKADGEKILSNGGRVLNVCATGKTVTEAQQRAYAAVDKIKWPEGFCRRDIGWQAVKREKAQQIARHSGRRAALLRCSPCRRRWRDATDEGFYQSATLDETPDPSAIASHRVHPLPQGEREVTQCVSYSKSPPAALAVVPCSLERLDDVLADLPLVHFVGTVDQPLRAHLGVPFRQRRILGKAERAVQLDRGVDHLVHHVGMEDLGDRVFLPDVLALFRLVGDVQQHQPADIEFAGAIGQHELHALAVG